jgi:HD superfamily phosphodiesterase
MLEPGIEIWIDRSEATWLDSLYNHAAYIFKENTLPSHDHSHHMRVWNLCKTLLREIDSFNTLTDQTLVDGILIAAFFHDLGMAFSTREDHGRFGSELCKSWFRETGKDKPERFEEILRAIELHDRKDVQIYTTFSLEKPPEILGILSVADDLEAMGVIGIYRYAEIYLERGIPLEELGTRVLENAAKRFKNLSEGCRLCVQLVVEYRQQYDELRQFFEQYNLQLKGTSKPDTVFSGQLGVINYIRTPGLRDDASQRAYGEVNDFFKKLEYELDQARL